MKHHKKYLGILALLLPMMVEGAIYKTIDENGNVVFTDTKLGNLAAEEVKLKPITPLPPTSIPNYVSAPKQTQERGQKDFYSTLGISEPANEATVRNNGNFTVKVQLQPRLARGHSIRFSMDGKPVGKPKRALNFTVLNADRGSHKLLIEVITAGGELIQAAQNNIYVQRTAIKQPPPSN